MQMETKVGVATLKSDKINFKTKAIEKNKEGHYILIKGSIQEEDITVINIYVSNTWTLKYIKQILTDIKRETNNNTLIVGDFDTPMTSIDKIIQTEY